MAELNVPNRTLYHSDNLPVLRGINSESIDLIATDPPFNKGKDFHATPDSLASGAKFQDRWNWADDVEGEWVDRITDDWPKVMTVINAARESYGDDMGAFLCFLGVRLLECHRVLKATGSIYLHIDHTAHAYVKALMDAIFGKANFQNEIVWAYKRWTASSRRLPRVHDTILWYTKTSAYTFAPPRVPNDTPNPSQYVSAKDRGGKTITRKDTDGNPIKREVAKEIAVGDWWTIPILSPVSNERTGYPTQKPLALYERIIRASSDEGMVVLDPFAGCATTPVAAERLGRQWVAIDIWDGAIDVVRKRMEDNRQLLTESNPQVIYSTTPPTRTDDGEEAAPFIQVTERYREPDGPRMTRQEMYEHLLAQYGAKCQGCDRTFDDSRYLELDHNTPRSDGGLNHITNRILLCGPCNRAKSNTYTLSGLRRLNRRNGWMRG